MIENAHFQLVVDKNGVVSELYQKEDPYKMNWVIGKKYLEKTGYEDQDKLFGHFEVTYNNKTQKSTSIVPEIIEDNNHIHITYEWEEVEVKVVYDLERNENDLLWEIQLKNKSNKPMNVTDFGVWSSFAYVMFRDKNVLKNIHQSAAVFPTISTDFTKLSIVRRDNEYGHLGMYQKEGQTLSIGTYCDYQNLFFENVSPSLDGLLFHKLILAGGYPEEFENRDWIYSKESLYLSPNETKIWSYILTKYSDKHDFEKQALRLNHPKINYSPLNLVGENTRIVVKVPENHNLKNVYLTCKVGNKLETIELRKETTDISRQYTINFKPNYIGEHKVSFVFEDGSEDFIVVNVMEQINKVIDERVEFICDVLYSGTSGFTPYTFEPISNQGESLGKLNLVLKKNLLGKFAPSQVRKVEESAVNYVRPKWFEDGNFKKPRKLYGEFYRCMDFEYIGHLFYLLSEFDNETLQLNDAKTYLKWAADVFNLRVNPELHEDQRGKEEAQMLGVYFLYINDLLNKLKENGLQETYETIQHLWEKVTDRVDSEASTYKAAITEHYYDNAGFGPTAASLSDTNHLESAKDYGNLLLANIGYSNDFRAQNPDRWWEALGYMIHSLWGGVTAAATFKVYEKLEDVRFLNASYRATAGILYCYDTHSTTTVPLKKGMAASTYAVAGPHLNRPDLSRERFGQSTFYKDGGIFTRLFKNANQTPDWDMGEELVAYLDNFGQQTFIIKEQESINVVNGSVEEKEDHYLVTSFAPYLKKVYLIDGNKRILLSHENNQIILKKEVES